jgi:hypothetical protein
LQQLSRPLLTPSTRNAPIAARLSLRIHIATAIEAAITEAPPAIESTDKQCGDCGSPFSTDPCCFEKREVEARKKIEIKAIPVIESTDKKCSDCGSPFSTDPCCFNKREVDARKETETKAAPVIESIDKQCGDCGSPFSTDPCCFKKREVEARKALEAADQIETRSDCGSPFSTDPHCFDQYSHNHRGPKPRHTITKHEVREVEVRDEVEVEVRAEPKADILVPVYPQSLRFPHCTKYSHKQECYSGSLRK